MAVQKPGLIDERKAHRETRAQPGAPEVIAREVSAGAGLLTPGPLTDVAAAIGAHARTSRARLTLMGGSARAGGNARPTAEANIAHDPSSAAAVLAAPWAQPPLMVGPDVTHTATMTDAELAILGRRLNRAADFSGRSPGGVPALRRQPLSTGPNALPRPARGHGLRGPDPGHDRGPPGRRGHRRQRRLGPDRRRHTPAGTQPVRPAGAPGRRHAEADGNPVDVDVPRFRRLVRDSSATPSCNIVKVRTNVVA
ncbi:nucleoside hydrolase [Micromonospora sp. NPDC023814]|uniref:nucleoside hydrolase n=1 Tax=Micromonospora sp. NPDC023814 TaxID=3154596 RepID=UPI00340BC9B0